MANMLRAIRKQRSRFIERYIIPKRRAKKSALVDEYIRRLNSKERRQNIPIKVGFVVQMPEIWNKEAPVYERMIKDPRFDPWLIVVPAYNLVTRKLGQYGKELEYFKSTYPNANILTSKELSSSFRKLKDCGFDYIFYQRCWEMYIPKALHTNQVLKFAKTCYIPYHYHDLEAPDSYYSTRFFNNLYVLFCSSKMQANAYQPTYGRHSIFLGYPPLSSARFDDIPDYQRLRLAWTPRWTTDPFYGGSTFWKYKDNFVALKRSNPELSILLRPHPLTFPHMIQTGRMSVTDVQTYRTQNENAGVSFDKNKDFGVTLQNIDVIISDYSSIIIESLMCGKIILYCGDEPSGTPGKVLSEVFQCSYRCSSWDEIVSTIKLLQSGEDPLAPARKQLSEKIQQFHYNCPERIIEYIIKDSCGVPFRQVIDFTQSE